MDIPLGPSSKGPQLKDNPCLPSLLLGPESQQMPEHETAYRSLFRKAKAPAFSELCLFNSRGSHPSLSHTLRAAIQPPAAEIFGHALRMPEDYAGRQKDAAFRCGTATVLWRMKEERHVLPDEWSFARPSAKPWLVPFRAGSARLCRWHRPRQPV